MYVCVCLVTAGPKTTTDCQLDPEARAREQGPAWSSPKHTVVCDEALGGQGYHCLLSTAHTSSLSRTIPPYHGEYGPFLTGRAVLLTTHLRAWLDRLLAALPLPQDPLPVMPTNA